MSLEFAIEHLYRTGWRGDEEYCERLPDGRMFPSIFSVQLEFSRAGLELFIKHNLIFDCYRVAWAPLGEALESDHAVDEQHGTVVGACEKEAAVYALAQLRTEQAKQQVALA